MFEYFQIYTNFNYYLRLLNGPKVKIWQTFFATIALIGIINAIFVTFQIKSKLYDLGNSITTDLISNYPQDLIINWTGSELLLEPKSQSLLVIDWPKAISSSGLPNHFGIYDAGIIDNTANLALAKTLNSLILINKNQLWVYSTTSKQWSEGLFLESLFPSKDFPPLQITSQNLPEKVTEFNKYLKQFIQKGLIILPIFLVISYWLSGLLFALVEASFIWLISKIFHWPVAWSRIFFLSLLIVPVAQTMEFITTWIYPNLTWSLFHLTYWLIFVTLSLSFPDLIRSSQFSKSVTKG